MTPSDLERELAEAREQQAATAEILRAISASRDDAQPVFDLLAQRAGTLCRAHVALVSRFDGKLIELAAIHGAQPDAVEVARGLFPQSPDWQTISARTVRSGEVVHVADVLADDTYEAKQFAIAAHYRAALGVPIFQGDAVMGAIFVGRTAPGLFTPAEVELLRTFAQQAAIAIDNARQFRQLEQSLRQQAATSDVLRAISRSTFDLGTVLHTLVESAARLCEADKGTIAREKDGVFYRAESYGFSEQFKRAVENLPIVPDRSSATGRALLEGRVVHIADAMSDPEYTFEEARRTGEFRTILAIPMMREGIAIGVIALTRDHVRPFTDEQIALLSTFAEQAVIAIENTRLLTELEARNHDLTKALEQQTATSDILRVISQSRTDVQPVFDTIAQSALALCGASSSAVMMKLDDGLLHLRALASATEEGANAIRAIFPRPPGRDNAATRAVQTGEVIEIPDVVADADFATTGLSLAAGFRSALSVPLLRDRTPIGAITVGRPTAGRFPPSQVELLRTFADQAVIAIENVRLFTELQARNRDLTEALDQQTATSDILRVISTSRTNVRPVFETIAQAALTLCGASSAAVMRIDDGLLHVGAIASITTDGAEAIRAIFPRPPSRDTGATRAVLTRELVEIPDVTLDPEFVTRSASVAAGFRSVVAVPLLRDGSAIGVITLGRPTPGRFPPSQVELLRTFADQAVIAVENGRLLSEIEARTAELTRSVNELRALGDVGRAVSSTLDLETVLSTIVTRATELTNVDGGSIYEYDEAREEFHLHTSDRLPQEIVDALRANPIRKGEGGIGRMALTASPVQIVDVADPSQYQSRVRDVLVKHGLRSILAVPLMRDNQLLGGLAVNRGVAGAFDPQVIELLQTFAAQSAIAIQNARLFREIESKGRALETASRHKSEFLANMSHELRTPLNAIIGFSDVLGERLFGPLNDKQAEYVADIADSGRHLLSLINDILDLSKIEAGRMELDAADFDLAKAVGHAASLVRERAQRRGIALSTHCDEGIGVVHGDERKVKQVLLNLLSNALKFTPEGGRVDIAVHRLDGRVEVSVRDTGVGIAAQDRDAVFEEFRQVGARNARVEGTGLGLAIARKFVELHGGRIWLESEVGSGSTFTFSLPLR